MNELRERRGAESLVLAQTGGEAEIGDLAREVLERIGWRAEPLDIGFGGLWGGPDSRTGCRAEKRHGDATVDGTQIGLRCAGDGL